MTGIDCLRAEMERRGASKAQIESKTAVMVLDILTEANGKYSDLAKLEDDIQEYNSALEKKKSELENVLSEYLKASTQCNTAKAEAQKLIDKELCKVLEYIETFNKALEECETAEGRDAMRRAQVYVNSVNIKNDANNTYFIQGLAMVMAGYPLGNITKFEKSTIPEPKEGQSTRLVSDGDITFTFPTDKKSLQKPLRIL